MSLMSEVAFEYKGTRHAFESMSEPEAADLAWKLECHRDRQEDEVIELYLNTETNVWEVRE
jgi:hypothetical protein